MTELDDQIKEDENRPVASPGPWEAIIATDATDQSDLLFVTIPQYSPQLRFGPCRWQARSDTALPARGDKALVMKSSAGKYWIISWWPF